jgi:crotonobetainyl-CoA:carnitine CoA-transferase CaiB-like acyl-CoA transferase
VFLSKTAEEWIAFGNEVNTPIGPVNTPTTLQDDPQFQDRLGWIPAEVLGAEQLPSPIKPVGGELPTPTKAPTPGQHRDEILREVLGYDDERIAQLDAAGAFGPRP